MQATLITTRGPIGSTRKISPDDLAHHPLVLDPDIASSDRGHGVGRRGHLLIPASEAVYLLMVVGLFAEGQADRSPV